MLRASPPATLRVPEDLPPPPRAVPRRKPSSGTRRALLAVTASAAIGFGAVLATDLPAGIGFASRLWQAPARSAAASQDDAVALYLVRSTLMALDDANRTGNYTVLRDLASPAFQATNPPARLAEIFAGHRQAQLDLSVASFSAPRWLQPPAVGNDRLLRLIGRFDQATPAIDFAIAFEPVAGAWRLYEIHVLPTQERRDR